MKTGAQSRFCTRLIAAIETFEHVSMRVFEAAEHLLVRAVLFTLAAIEAYRLLVGR